MSNTGSCCGDNRLVLVVANTAWSIFNFRSGLLEALRAAGYRVTAVAPEDGYESCLPCEFTPVRLNRKSINPFEDLRFAGELRRIYRRLRPFAVLHFTSKVNIYGTLAARGLGVRCIDNISGLGSAFLGGGLVAGIQKLLYRLSLRHAYRVFFQNPDDADHFVRRRLVFPSRIGLLPGSGINLQRFRPRPKPPAVPFNFLLIARLLRDKGIYEYVEAARSLKARYPAVEFRLVGFHDDLNPSAVRREEMERWVREGAVNFLGRREDVRGVIAEADCVVLPSYREGTPRTLLEAAGMARPIVTTDVPGCRQVVEDGVTGFLCQVRDAADLADKMEAMIHLDPADRERMGLRGRRKMEREYDETLVTRRYLEALTPA